MDLHEFWFARSAGLVVFFWFWFLRLKKGNTDFSGIPPYWHFHPWCSQPDTLVKCVSTLLSCRQFLSSGNFTRHRDARADVLRAVLLKCQVLWDMMLCHWASVQDQAVPACFIQKIKALKSLDAPGTIHSMTQLLVPGDILPRVYSYWPNHGSKCYFAFTISLVNGNTKRGCLTWLCSQRNSPRLSKRCQRSVSISVMFLTVSSLLARSSITLSSTDLLSCFCCSSSLFTWCSLCFSIAFCSSDFWFNTFLPL